ncbi:hypothetical protein STEG23_001150 [Scotinomys teguina]
MALENLTVILQQASVRCGALGMTRQEPKAPEAQSCDFLLFKSMERPAEDHTIEGHSGWENGKIRGSVVFMEVQQWEEKKREQNRILGQTFLGFPERKEVTQEAHEMARMVPSPETKVVDLDAEDLEGGRLLSTSFTKAVSLTKPRIHQPYSEDPISPFKGSSRVRAKFLRGSDEKLQHSPSPRMVTTTVSIFHHVEMFYNRLA